MDRTLIQAETVITCGPDHATFSPGGVITQGTTIVEVGPPRPRPRPKPKPPAAEAPQEPVEAPAVPSE